MLASVNRMLYGEPPGDLPRGDVLRLWLAPLAANFVALARARTHPTVSVCGRVATGVESVGSIDGGFE